MLPGLRPPVVDADVRNPVLDAGPTAGHGDPFVLQDAGCYALCTPAACPSHTPARLTSSALATPTSSCARQGTATDAKIAAMVAFG
jgi:hypothetical protein